MNTNLPIMMSRLSLPKNWLALVFLFVLQSNIAQSQLSATIDTTQIKIGEQLNFALRVETDTTATVIFPEGQAFSPLEVIDTTLVDTTRLKNRHQLIKTYGLTSFDSGYYFIPRQRVLINNNPFYTDSLVVRVNDLVVDTLKQKMYDIKPIIAVNKSGGDGLKYLLFGLIGLFVIAALLYFLVFKQKPPTEEEKEALLPPFERALLNLKKLENSQYLIKSEQKKYYSELTDIVRNYIEEDVHISAMESTTDELIAKLEALSDNHTLELEKDTINNFKRVLQTADLVKFAKSKPDNSQAIKDTVLIEQIVKKTKDALPEPTEADLLHDETYLEELQKKKRNKKIILVASISTILLLCVLGGAVGYYGFNQVKDTLLGHPSKELLEGDWVHSAYGSPAVSISTPRVLKRKEVSLPPELQATIKQMHSFEYGSFLEGFNVVLNSTVFKEQKEIDFEKTIEGTITALEAQGVKNILVKSDSFATLGGAEGLKTYGSWEFPNPASKRSVKSNYTILTFGAKGILHQIIVNWRDGDTYAETMVDRILSSVELKTEH
jgi:hypothetical protein